MKNQTYNQVYRLIAVTVIFTICNTTMSQNNWEQINIPANIELNDIYFHDNDIYLGAKNGIYFSNDNLQTLNCIGLEGYSVGNILVTSNDELMACTSTRICKYLGNSNWSMSEPLVFGPYFLKESSQGFLFYGSWIFLNRSIDNGNTWDVVLSVNAHELVNDIEETSEGILFVGTASHDSNPGGIYRSDDYGETWNFAGLESHEISSLEINSNDILFSAYYSIGQAPPGGVSKSLDTMGVTWESIYDNNLVVDLKINKFNTIVIGCTSFGYPGGVWCSYDNGETWNDITGNLPSSDIHHIYFSPDNYLYSLVYPDNDLLKLTNPITSEIEINSNNDIRIFPNPVTNKFVIEGKSNEIFKVSLSDINGKLMFISYSEAISNNRIELDIMDINDGIYILTVETRGKIVSKKIIKKQ